MFLGLGVFSLTKEAAEKLINEAVEKGEISRDEARKFIDEALRRGEEQKEELKTFVRQELQKLRIELGLVSKDELEELRTRLEELERKVQD